MQFSQDVLFPFKFFGITQ